MKQVYDMTKSFSLKGDWFLPDNPGMRLSGEVSYDTNVGIHLELIGDFKGDILGAEGYGYPTILGVVEGSRDISLFGCTFISRGQMTLVSGSEMAKPVMTFVANAMIDGWHFMSDKDVLAKTLIFELDGLDEWLHVTGFKFSDVKLDLANHSVDMHYQLPKPIPFEYPIGCEASFVFVVSNLSQPVYRTSFELYQKVRIRIENYNGFTLSDIYNIIYEFQSFLMTCTPGEPYVRDVFLFNPDYSIELQDGRSVNRKLTLFYNQHFTIKENKWNFMFMMIPYSLIKDAYPTLIKKWDGIFSDFEPAINLLVEQIRDKNTFNDNDFLNLAQAAETIHDRINPDAVKMPKEEYDELKTTVLDHVPEEGKAFVAGLLQYGNNVSFATRIKELVDSCPDAIINVFIPDKDIFVKEIRDSRNYYTHYTLSNKKHVKRGYGLLRLSERLQMLLVLVLLLHIGVDADLLEKNILGKKSFYQYLLETPE